jgi:arsenate reductase
MAEGLVNGLLGETWQAYSAGTQPGPEVQPLAVEALAEIGLDISAGRPKHVSVYREQALDLVITLCDNAAKTCPLWLGQGRVVHIGFPDPALAQGDHAERLAAYRQVRDAIRGCVLAYLEEVHDELAGSRAT